MNAEKSPPTLLREYSDYFTRWATQLADSPKSRAEKLFYDLGLTVGIMLERIKRNGQLDLFEDTLKIWEEAQRFKIINGLGPNAKKFE